MVHGRIPVHPPMDGGAAMKTWTVYLRCTAWNTVEVEAETKEEAMEKAVAMKQQVDEFDDWEVDEVEEVKEVPKTIGEERVEGVAARTWGPEPW